MFEKIVPSLSADVVLPLKAMAVRSSQVVVVIGASTGGTEALRVLLTALPSHMPPILVTQHMPEAFTASFATRLDHLCALRVKEAGDGEPIVADTVYIAPGDAHLMIQANTRLGLTAALNQGALVNRHRPSVDVLFRSAANCVGKYAIGILLTGMGRDGAMGLSEMHAAGAYTLAQDETSCVVFGMPKQALSMGAVDEMLPLEEIASRLISLVAKSDAYALRNTPASK